MYTASRDFVTREYVWDFFLNRGQPNIMHHVRIHWDEHVEFNNILVIGDYCTVEHANDVFHWITFESGERSDVRFLNIVNSYFLERRKINEKSKVPQWPYSSKLWNIRFYL